MPRISPKITAVLSMFVLIYSIYDFNKFVFIGALLVFIVSIVMIIQNLR